MDPAERISAGLSRMGLEVTSAQAAQLAAHLEAVMAQNRTLNLTAVRPEDAVVLHVLDSCAATEALTRAPAGPFADIGTGAGYPGIPLSVLTGRTAELVESTKKKAEFLQEVVGRLCLNATFRPLRAEELAVDHAGSYAAVTARAVARLASLVELAAPLLAMNGSLICLKGAPSQEELRAADAAAPLCGMGPGQLWPVSVPGLDAARVLVIYQRTGGGIAKLPRRPGMAQSRPLA